MTTYKNRIHREIAEKQEYEAQCEARLIEASNILLKAMEFDQINDVPTGFELVLGSLVCFKQYGMQDLLILREVANRHNGRFFPTPDVVDGFLHRLKKYLEEG